MTDQEKAEISRKATRETYWQAFMEEAATVAVWEGDTDPETLVGKTYAMHKRLAATYWRKWLATCEQTERAA